MQLKDPFVLSIPSYHPNQWSYHVSSFPTPSRYSPNNVSTRSPYYTSPSITLRALYTHLSHPYIWIHIP